LGKLFEFAALKFLFSFEVQAARSAHPKIFALFAPSAKRPRSSTTAMRPLPAQNRRS